MKTLRKILLGITASVLLNCNALENTEELIIPNEIESSFENSKNIAELTQLVNGYITYHEQEKVQSPQETLDTKKGDCADMTILLMKLSNTKFGIESNMFLFEIINKETGKWEGEGHNLMKYEGIYYDPTYNLVKDNINFYNQYYDIFFSLELNYNDAMGLIDY